MKRWAVYLLAVLASLFVGYFDLHASEVQGSVLVILILTFGLGFIEPKRAWLWALMIGLSVSAAYIVGPMLGIQPRELPQPAYGTLIALIPAFIGAYSGAIGNKLIFPTSRRFENL